MFCNLGSCYVFTRINFELNQVINDDDNNNDNNNNINQEINFILEWFNLDQFHFSYIIHPSGCYLQAKSSQAQLLPY